MRSLLYSAPPASPERFFSVPTAPAPVLPPTTALSLSTNKLILIAPCAILSSRKNNGGKHGNDKAENMGNNG